jgi:3-phytase/alkaline phosphatase D
VSTKGATDISRLDALGDATRPIVPVEKELLLDFDQLGVRLDNVEGMTLGPTLPDGRQSLVLVSDNNFSTRQETQFLAFALNLDTSPGPAPDDGGGWWR